MKLIIVVAISLMSLALEAQETVYYDADMKILSSAANAKYYSKLTRNKDSVNQATLTYYFISGKKEGENHYSDYEHKIRGGKSTDWYENGQVKTEVNILNGQLDGELKSYFDNGVLKRLDFYKNGDVVSGKCFNRDGQEISYFPYFVAASFPGGDKGWQNYLMSELKYPKKSIKSNTQGTVIVQFIIAKDGSVSDVSIYKSVSKALDEEAIRVIKIMPNWKPAKQDGVIMKSYAQQPITFKFETQ
jgi:periplasmic protein TonB